MTFLNLSLLIVSKYWPPQFGLDQSERKHASVIWRLFLTFRRIYAHPHLNLSSIPNFHPFFTLQFSSLSLPSHFFRFPSILSSSLWTTGNVSSSVLTPMSFILLSDVQELLQLFYRDQSSSAVEVISCPCWTENQTSATAKTNSYLSKPVKTKTPLSKIRYEWH